jgi:phosphoribosylanthranilate isomerase
MTAVKICGLKSSDALEAALNGGADYIGLVFFPRSPRHLDLETAARLARSARGRARIVALLVDPADELVLDVLEQVSPDIVQLHGSETPERVAAIGRKAKLPILKAIKVETDADAAEALRYQGAADIILFDAKAPKGAPVPGGNGIAFDWRALENVRGRLGERWMLSGGLTPENVAEAIRLTGAPAVDVSSGVETSPGEKSPDLIRRFLHAAKTAKQRA